ncbi:cysteine proteinase [Thozetella sp. PMI_491]|nr:cysteine proteinase [Thozetella sp. PMI_491]
MMNNRGHLPAGQPIPPMQGAMDMGPGPGPAPGVGVGLSPQGPGSGGPRRSGRPHQPYPAHHSPYQPQHPHMSQHQPMYAAHGYMPYAAPPYYSPMPPQYHQNGGMAPSAYIPYPQQQQYARSPPMPQQYAPMVPQSYSRPPHHSPIVGNPYQVAPPAAPVPLPPHTPSSTHSSSVAIPPPIASPIPSQVVETPAPPAPSQPPSQPEPQPQPEPPLASPLLKTPALQLGPTESYMPKVLLPLPWLSTPDELFPKRTTRLRRRRKIVVSGSGNLQLPSQHPSSEDAGPKHGVDEEQSEVAASYPAENATATTPKAAKKSAALEPPPRSETPSTQDQPSEGASTSPTTPISLQPSATSAMTPTQSAKPASRAAVPALPAVPVIPKPAPEGKGSEKVEGDSADQTVSGEQPAEGLNGPSEVSSEATETAPAPVKVAPKLWTGLFAKASAAAKAPAAVDGQPDTNGVSALGVPGIVPPATAFANSSASSVAEAIQAYQVGGAEKLAFLEPRGLVNTGNMCYMNSVLQVLIFCIPFYDFLDQVSKKAAHSFKSETPLIDAMIMFMREFNVIDSATSVDQLKRRLKIEELEQYGEPFIPEFVYDAIRRLPRFASMRRGHQQDAEEFLGFLLEGLHDECAQVLRAAPISTASTAPNSSLPSPTSSSKDADGDDWLEVGRRQKPSVTRSSGYSNVSSPITKIFGGQLRSELRVPGLKNSVTLEPYQPLQLDIGAPHIRNIVDALKGLTRPETLVGDFNSPHGKDAKATKQVFIESLPPVLILHLKRFQFDAEGHGTVKIWKKVGYPLELEIPAEVVSRQRRNTTLASGAGLPKYRLSAVVYHHGKNASGGHYTVDVRRQDGREWIRLDDTVIHRVASEDVAEGGAEEDSAKSSSSQQDSRKETFTTGSNRFGGMNDEDAGDDDGWKQAPANGKKWSSVVNGAGGGSSPAANGPRSKQIKDNIKDNKVAYLLFYERI